jgi:dihydroorotate dehydrogenase
MVSTEASPFRHLGGGGGVSGKLAQEHNWAAAEALTEQRALPVIWPSVMSKQDVDEVLACGAEAVSFGAIHIRKPWLPTKIVQAIARERQQAKTKENKVGKTEDHRATQI